jgi:hypothetical protein
MTKRYVQYDWLPQKREALERWAEHLESIVASSKSAEPVLRD